jgi:hypothetical protein
MKYACCSGDKFILDLSPFELVKVANQNFSYGPKGPILKQKVCLT